MHFNVSLLTNAGHLCVSTRLIRSFFMAGVTALSLGVYAQSVPVASLSTKTPAPSTVVVASASTWPSLSKAQQAALEPLAASWNALSEGQKRKWVAIAASYPSRTQAEQEKLHSRMAEWAALSPKDREVARLNFAHSKTIANSDRAANWEAYQALSPEERKKLAAVAKVKPVGAAVAVKPVAPEKLAAVPVTRHTPASERDAVVSQTPLNRNTLLPKVPAPVTAAGLTAPTLLLKP
jgi:hypothetical protein